MNTTSLQLSKELYELSGWGWQDQYFTTHYGEDDDNEQYPAYDLGYLLRKLPGFTNLYKESSGVEFKAQLQYGERLVRVWAHTPEDAVAKLAIELFKKGIL